MKIISNISTYLNVFRGNEPLLRQMPSVENIRNSCYLVLVVKITKREYSKLQEMKLPCSEI